jgi:DNA uptake protein ComE-like DNA-binding protein
MYSFLFAKINIASDRTIPLLVIMVLVFCLGLLFPTNKSGKIPILCAKMVDYQGQIRCDGKGTFAGSRVLLDGKKIDLNSASEVDLLRIPRLSKNVARAIVSRRKELGRFTRIEQVDVIKGVGIKTRNRLLQMTTIGY